jgi:hypothetical protein
MLGHYGDGMMTLMRYDKMGPLSPGLGRMTFVKRSSGMHHVCVVCVWGGGVKSVQEMGNEKEVRRHLKLPCLNQLAQPFFNVMNRKCVIGKRS